MFITQDRRVGGKSLTNTLERGPRCFGSRPEFSPAQKSSSIAPPETDRAKRVQGKLSFALNKQSDISFPQFWWGLEEAELACRVSRRAEGSLKDEAPASSEEFLAGSSHAQLTTENPTARDAWYCGRWTTETRSDHQSDRSGIAHRREETFLLNIAWSWSCLGY